MKRIVVLGLLVNPMFGGAQPNLEIAYKELKK